MMKCNFWILLFNIILVRIGCVCEVYLEHNKQTSEYVVIDVNKAATLKCKSNEPITWVSLIISKFPYNAKVHINYSQKYHKYNEIEYQSHLELKFVTVDLVGFYYCILTSGARNVNFNIDGSMKTGQNYIISDVYVFVNDPSRPLLVVENRQIVVKQYSEFIIPCKPTEPNTKVELVRNNGIAAQFMTNYDPKFGFSIFFSNFENGGLLRCRLVNNHNIFQEYYVTVFHTDLSEYLPKPHITSRSKNYALNGETFKLDCHFHATTSLQALSLKFVLPNGKQAISNEKVTVTPLNKYSISSLLISLTVNNPHENNDKGDYTCYVEDTFNNSNFAVQPIKFIAKPFIQFDSYFTKLTRKLSFPAEFMFNFSGCPDIKLEYYKDEELIGNDSKVIFNPKYDLKIFEDQIIFKISYLELGDHGNYTFVLSNKAGKIKKNVELAIAAKPECFIKSIYALHGEEISFKCECKASPKADIIWYFKFCNHQCARYSIIKNTTIDTKTHGHTQISEIKFIAEDNGVIECHAINNLGNSGYSAKLQVSDISEPFKIIEDSMDKDHKIAVGDELKLECRALSLNYMDNIRWLKDGFSVHIRNDLSIISRNTKFSHGRTLHFRAIRKEDEGVYACEVNDNHQKKHYITKHLKVFDPEFPSINTSFSENKMSKMMSENLRIDCIANGLPTPVVTWKKNGKSIILEEHSQRLRFRNNNMTLDFIALAPEDSGHYECFAENRLARIEKSVHIFVKSDHNNNILIGSFAALIFLILLLLLAWLKIYRNKKLIAELKAAGLENFEEGNLDCINSDINLDEQADLLPYDKKFEFPRDKLQLKKQLGAGAFGVVHKGIANGIVEYQSESIVAVKMVKKQASNEVIKALVSELKILIHLGEHLNIVNLLGAVTKNIANRELMVIFEYCRFGNLQTYLVKNRSNFIDQVRNGKIAPVLKEGESSDEGSGLKFVSVAIVNDKTNPGSNEGDSSQSNENVNLDTKVRTSLCTSDLVCWAFQIASGMEYLSRVRIIHGDLAARNILLCDNNVVKICDFGLSKSIHKNDIYKRQGKSLLPFKWLSLEAISKSEFSVHSDVWSFGIMLWEFFSLGTVPYPGMDADENLFYKIREGYRMEKPDYATQDIYDTMLSCWNVMPESRPLFSELKHTFSSLMVDSVKNHYVVLNDKYIRANVRNDKGDARDYLRPFSVVLNNAPKPSSSQHENLYTKSKESKQISESSASNSQPVSDHMGATKPSSSVANIAPNIEESIHFSSDKNNSKLQFHEELRLKLLKRNKDINT